MSAYTEIKNLLEKTNDNVKRNVEIITPDELGQDKLFHIATLKFTSLIPNVSRRGAVSEDNTITRVHTAPSLLQCIRGHATVFDMALNYIVSTSKNAKYKGGFYIYQIPFEAALKPNKKLVYDADYTEEIWLVNYNEETRFYKPDAIGKFVICSAKVENVNKELQTTLEIAVEVPEGMNLIVDKVTTLSKGYWLCLFKQVVKQNKDSDISFLEAKMISNLEFDNLRKYHAAMLSI